MIRYLSHLVLYQPGADDLAAIRVGLTDTNDETEVWFSYSLAGEGGTIHLKLAHDAESPLVIHIHARVPKSIDREVETVLSLAGAYVISEPAIGAA